MKLKVFLFVIFLILIGFFTSWLYHEVQEEVIYYHKARNFFEKSEYEKAIPFYEKSIQANPSFLKSLYDIAICYKNSNKLNEAIQTYKKILSVKIKKYEFVTSDYIFILNNLADLYRRNGELEKAVNNYKKIISTVGKEDWENLLVEHVKVDSYLKLADIYSWQGKYNKAIKIYKKIVKKSDNLKAKRKLAKVYIWNEDFQKAQELLENILVKSPGDFGSWELLAKTKHYSGKYKKAIKDYKKAIKEKGKKTGQIQISLGKAYMAMKNYDKAIDIYKKVLSNNSDNIEVRVKLANIYSWQKKNQKAIENYKKVLKLQPDNIKVKSKLAKVYLWNKEYKKSKDLYKDIIKKDSDRTAAYIQLVKILNWEEKYKQAINYFKKIPSNRKDKNIRLLYAKTILYLGKYNEAKKILQDILKKEHKNVKALKYLAETNVYGGEYDKAISIYKKILKENEKLKIKEKIKIEDKLADVLSWNRKYSEAINIYNKILKEKNNYKIQLKKARVLGWKKDYKAAIKEYKKILSDRKNKAVKLEMRAKKAYWNEKYIKAIKYFEKLLEINPDNSEALFDLSQIYLNYSMWEPAVKLYKKLLQLYPTHFRAKKALKKINIINNNIALSSGYEFFEADSSDRTVDIKKHTIYGKIDIPLNYHSNLGIRYDKSKRFFSDFESFWEDNIRINYSYYNKPYWKANLNFSMFDYKNETDNIYTFGGTINRRIFDSGSLEFSYQKKRLTNSSEVLRNKYYKNNYKGRMDLDIGRRLDAGIDYTYSDYSDNNNKHKSGIDLLYYLSLEPKRLSIKYRYSYKNFDENLPAYFSPKDFWTNAIRINWRHYLNEKERFWGIQDIYYDLIYKVAVDSEDITSHNITGRFYWDITDKFSLNLKASTTVSSSNVYTDTNTTISFKYFF